jgi:hypothetical protein
MASRNRIKQQHATTPRNNTTQQHHATTPRNNTTQQHHATTPRNNTTQQHHATTPRNNTAQRHDDTVNVTDCCHHHRLNIARSNSPVGNGAASRREHSEKIFRKSGENVLHKFRSFVQLLS